MLKAVRSRSSVRKAVQVVSRVGLSRTIRPVAGIVFPSSEAQRNHCSADSKSRCHVLSPCHPGTLNPVSNPYNSPLVVG